MKKEYDFSKGERGKFYHPDALFHFPVYLDPDVNETISKLAEERNLEVQELVNQWLRMNIKIIQIAQQ